MRLISADALRETMYHEAFETDTDMQKWDSGCWIRYKMFENALENAPTIDAEPVKHGKWIWEECVYKCSECSHKAYGNILECMDGTYKYCPNCGARLEIEENERKRANETNTTI